jgi:hypothetical protein
MSNQVLLKKSSVGARVPQTTDLAYGEVALNYADGLLYFKDSSNVIRSFASLNATATLTNKTLSSATLTGTLTAGGGVGTSGQVLTSTGTGVQWGSSGGGSTTNPLTIGTGLSGSSFNGSAAVTIAIDSTVTTNSGTQTLTNKTLSAPVVTGTLTANGVVGASGQFLSSTGTGVQWSSAIAGGYMAIYARASTFNVFVYVGQLPVYARAGTFSVTI